MARSTRHTLTPSYVIIVTIFLSLILIWNLPNPSGTQTELRASPFIFIGGYPRSGSTLMRDILEAHPDVKCGQDFSLLEFVDRIQEFKGSKAAVSSATGKLINRIFFKEQDPSKNVCIEVPNILEHARYLSNIFDDSKFIFVIRDGRAIVHSMKKDKETNNVTASLEEWNKAVEKMSTQCEKIGEDRCFLVYYENVILTPQEELQKVAEFLNVNWNYKVLERMITETKFIPDTEEEQMKVLETIDEWAVGMSPEFIRAAPMIAPQLFEHRYDIFMRYPVYDLPIQRIWKAYEKRVLQQKTKLGYFDDPVLPSSGTTAATYYFKNVIESPLYDVTTTTALFS